MLWGLTFERFGGEGVPGEEPEKGGGDLGWVGVSPLRNRLGMVLLSRGCASRDYDVGPFIGAICFRKGGGFRHLG
jgi:hypothetical protein